MKLMCIVLKEDHKKILKTNELILKTQQKFKK